MFRSIPVVTRNLLLVNIVVFLVGLLFEKQFDISKWGSLHFFLASDFNVLQFITYQFLHANFTHIFFNMFALWMFGCTIENVWGGRKFLFYYLVCGIGAGLCQEIVQYIQYTSMHLADYDTVSLGNGMIVTMDTYLNQWGTIGASGSVYGILLAFGMLFPDNRIFIFPLPVPIKAKWFVVIYAGIELLLAYTSSGDNVAHVAHLGGMLFGFLLITYWRHHPGDFEADLGKYFKKTKKKDNDDRSSRNSSGFGPTREDDMEYNRQRKLRQERVDEILDKIRRSGYDSLTAEEKQYLFNASHET